MPPTLMESTTSVPSPYAEALQKGGNGAPFGRELEAEYVRNRLLGSRTLIRMACALAVFLIAFRAAENALSGTWAVGPSGLPLTLLAFVAGSSLLLAAMAWSRAFERFYLPVAQVTVPARNMAAVVPITVMAAKGQLELLMLLPIMVLGPFFFLGLPYRGALISVVLTVVSFLSAALFAHLPAPVLLRACGFLLLTAAACAIAARELERAARKSFLESRLIAEFAEQDALTGTKNRRVFDEHLARLWRQAIDDGRKLVIALIDVDHFKAYNDRYGHQAGDHALCRVAQVLKTFVNRPLDVLARYGGEEFAVLLFDIDERQAAHLAECMRRAVSDIAIEHRGARGSRQVTVSIGVAAIAPRPQRLARGALQLADEGLYEAKVNGRNRVVVKGATEYDALETGIFAQLSVAREQQG